MREKKTTTPKKQYGDKSHQIKNTLFVHRPTTLFIQTYIIYIQILIIIFKRTTTTFDYILQDIHFTR